jgi:hypothetical protein
MSSQRRLEANQANARLSTGPQTPEGKARSSQNARKHGLSAREVVIAPDEREEFEEFLEAYQADLQPQGMTEQGLFNQLVLAAWNLQRISRLEADWAKDSDPLRNDYREASIERLARYHTRAERTYFRCLRELRVLQTNRSLREAQPEASALPPLASIAIWTKQTRTPLAPVPPEYQSIVYKCYPDDPPDASTPLPAQS